MDVADEDSNVEDDFVVVVAGSVVSRYSVVVECSVVDDVGVDSVISGNMVDAASS